MKLSRQEILVPALPAIFLLGLFYSFALHMFKSLGGWPGSIGEQGFSPLLAFHAKVTTGYFVVSLLGTFLAVPIGIVTCCLVPRWKGYTTHFAVSGFLIFVSWFLMGLAPQPYLDWWRD